MLEHLDPGFAHDPHPVWARLRTDEPLHHLEVVDAWVVTRYDDVHRVLRDDRLSPSRRYWKANEPPTPGPDGSVRPRARFGEEGLFNVDRDDHVRLRRMVAKAFTPRSIEQQRPAVERIVAGLLRDRRPGEPCDLVVDVAAPLPVAVIDHLVGVPPSLSGRFAELAEVLALTIEPLLDDDTERAVDDAIVEFEAIIEEVARLRRREPADDLMTRLLAVEDDDGTRFTHAELVNLVLGVLIAGSGTTANHLTESVVELARHRDQWRLVADGAVSPADALEELSRWACLGFGAPRFVVEPVGVAGEELAPGEMVFAALGSAHRDERQFADPERLDVTRRPTGLLTFGVGAHHCLGAALARMEMRVMLGELVGRYPSLELTAAPEHRTSFLFRTPVSAPVRL